MSRLDDALARLVELLQPQGPPPLKIRKGVVVSVAGSTVTVTVEGLTTPVTAHKLAHVSTVGGDTVHMVHDGNQLTIIGVH